MIYEQIPGWYDWARGTEEAVAHFGDGDTFVEVGVYLGKSLCHVGEVVRESGKRIRVVGVDWCRGSGVENGRDNHAEAVTNGGGSLASPIHRNLIDCGLADTVVMIVADSAVAAELFADGSLAWVNLDTQHDYDSVYRDIRSWLPKVRVGGWLTGDDLVPQIWPGVCRAVADLLPKATPWAHDSWRYVKGD